MTSHEELLPEPIEPDPTGMRALLASLPDPGPMPAGLETQILARLAELRADAGAAPVPAGPADGRGADVLPLVARGRDRSERRRWFTAAAGIAAAAVLGIVVTDGLQGQGWVSSVIGRSGSDSAGSAAADSSQQAEVKSGAQRDAFRASGTDYRAATLREQAASLLVQTVSQPGGSATDSGTEFGLDSCLTALGLTAADVAAVDRATYEGRPAYVVAWTREGRSSVVVTEPTCGTGGAHVVTGPTPLG